MAHTAQCHHFRDLILCDTVLATLSSETAELDTTKPTRL